MCEWREGRLQLALHSVTNLSPFLALRNLTTPVDSLPHLVFFISLPPPIHASVKLHTHTHTHACTTATAAWGRCEHALWNRSPKLNPTTTNYLPVEAAQ